MWTKDRAECLDKEIREKSKYLSLEMDEQPILHLEFRHIQSHSAFEKLIVAQASKFDSVVFSVAIGHGGEDFPYIDFTIKNEEVPDSVFLDEVDRLLSFMRPVIQSTL